MRAVVQDMPREWVDERVRRGLDRFDELWQGVLHMVPPPRLIHQRMGSKLLAFLEPLLRTSGIDVLYETGVFRPGSDGKDYRIPDLVFFSSDDTALMKDRGLEGAPLAVLEMRSPDDETYDKFPFWADIGVKEVIVIDPENRALEIYRLAGRQYVAVSADEQGRAHAATIDVRFAREATPDGTRLRAECRGESRMV